MAIRQFAAFELYQKAQARPETEEEIERSAEWRLTCAKAKALKAQMALCGSRVCPAHRQRRPVIHDQWHEYRLHVR